MDDLAVGSIFAGHTILAVAGRGAMGVVCGSTAQVRRTGACT
jgi:hypothetical protein